MITPFVEDRFDEAGFAHLLDRQVEAGVDGLTLLGSTSEEATLTREEKKSILRLGRATGLPLIVGIGTNCTRTTIEEIQFAVDEGASALLVTSPYYNRPTQEGLKAHFLSVANHSPLPLILYNHPGRTSVHIERATLETLVKHEQIQTLKDCSEDFDYLSDLAANLPLTLLSGNDSLTLPLMAIGGHGVISILSNLTPKKMKQLVDACACGDFSTARELHYELLPLFHATNVGSNPMGIKALMQGHNLPSGECRLPLASLPSHQFDALLNL